MSNIFKDFTINSAEQIEISHRNNKNFLNNFFVESLLKNIDSKNIPTINNRLFKK